MGCPLGFLQLLGILGWGAPKIIPKVCGGLWHHLGGSGGFQRVQGWALCSPPSLAALGGGGAQQGLRASSSVNKLSLIWITGICKHG